MKPHHLISPVEFPLRGAIAEGIVVSILRHAGYFIERYGRANGIPDYLVRHKDGRSWFVEVKYRYYPRIPIEDIRKYIKWNAKIVLVCGSNARILCMSPPYQFSQRCEDIPWTRTMTRDGDIIVPDDLEHFGCWLVAKYLKTPINNSAKLLEPIPPSH